MILFISGEGPTDVGTSRTSANISEGDDFKPGAMTMLVDQLVSGLWGYSPVDSGAFRWVHKSHLVELAKRKPRGRSPAERPAIGLPGHRRERETGYFYHNALALGTLALETETREQCSTMAVLFRDCDGTRSDGEGLWQDKEKSMRLGFKRAGYTRGVPMIPKPKSEAWLLCALQSMPYHGCARFEDLSGNDDAPKPAKAELAKALTQHGLETADLPGQVKDGSIDAARLTDMPSYKAFMERLIAVAKSMLNP